MPNRPDGVPPAAYPAFQRSPPPALHSRGLPAPAVIGGATNPKAGGESPALHGGNGLDLIHGHPHVFGGKSPHVRYFFDALVERTITVVPT